MKGSNCLSVPIIHRGYPELQQLWVFPVNWQGRLTQMPHLRICVTGLCSLHCWAVSQTQETRDMWTSVSKLVVHKFFLGQGNWNTDREKNWTEFSNLVNNIKVERERSILISISILRRWSVCRGGLYQNKIFQSEWNRASYLPHFYPNLPEQLYSCTLLRLPHGSLITIIPFKNLYSK